MTDNTVATTAQASAPATVTPEAEDDGIKRHRLSPAAHALLFMLLGLLLTLAIISAWPLSAILQNTVETPLP